MSTRLGLSSLLLASLLSSAHAHVTLEQAEAAVGGSYKAVFRVPHGCGTSPTVKVRVRIPESVIGAKPMPKAGWQIDTVRGKYEKSYAMYHATNITDGIKELSWIGRLLDENYDEFVVSVYLTDSRERTSLPPRTGRLKIRTASQSTAARTAKISIRFASQALTGTAGATRQKAPAASMDLPALVGVKCRKVQAPG